MDLKDKTIEELKALAYDQVLELQRVQQNLQILNAELAKRQEVKEEVKK